MSSLALALLSFTGIALQPGDRVAILASPPRVSDDESGEAEEARRRAMSGLDASSPSASASASATAASSPRSRPLFPADAALEALLAAAAAGAVACPLNGRLPAEALAGLLASLRPRVLFAPRRRGCAEAVAGALAAAAAAAAARRQGGHSREEGDDEGEEGAFFGLPRGPDAPVVVWLDDDGDGDESAPSLSLSSSFAQVSSAALLSMVARERSSSSSSSSFEPRFAPRDAAAIVFTSGTTSGGPRGALISHSSLHFQSRVKESRMRLRPRDAVLHAAPLFHVAGLSAAAAALLARCRKNVLLESGGWTRKGGRRASVEGGGVTALSAVSAMVFDLAAENEAEMLQRRKKMEGGERGKKGRGGEGERAGTEKEEEEQRPPPPPLSSVRVVLVGGGAPPPPRLLASAFPSPRVRVLTAYGLTEASSSVLWGEVAVGAGVGGGGGGGRASSASSSSSSSSLLNSSPPPGVEVAVAVFDERSSSGASSSTTPSSSLSWRHARAGEEGELLTRGAHVFKGYWRDAAATRAALLPASSSSSDSTTATTAAEASASAAAAAKTTLPWLRTGDAAVRLNETEGGCAGGIRILGRGADAIRVGGETVHAASTEASLLKSLTLTSSSAASSKAAISGVALVGLPHPRLGQVVAALVALSSGITWRGDVVVDSDEEEEGGGEKQQKRRPFPPPSAGCGVPLSLSTLRAAGRAAGLPGHALPRHAVATWVPLPTRGPLAKLDRAEALRLVERAVAAGRSGGGGAGEEVDDEPRPRL